jgi:polyhydroxybutyrate depolymerase
MTLRLFIGFFTVTLALAQQPEAPGLARQKLTVNGVEREALVYAPPKAKLEATPLVFAFHGHGGTMEKAAASFHIHKAWPDALVVYPQGLRTPGKLTDPEGKRTGWQSNAGHMEDRDLQFFDAMLAKLKEHYKVDARRIYSTGHSNGGGFTYLLWAERGEHFAAMAPSASAGLKEMAKLKPKPAMHIAGENDELVKFAWQSRMIEHLKKLNGCGPGVAWPENPHCTLHPSTTGTPFVTALHDGGHKYPEQAPAAIVQFFRQHALPQSVR